MSGFRRREVQERARLASVESRHETAIAHARAVGDTIKSYARQGLSLRMMAEALNLGALPPPRGRGSWHANTVRRILALLDSAGQGQPPGA